MSKCVSQDSELGKVISYYNQGEASAPAGKLLEPEKETRAGSRVMCQPCAT